jgi:hypothetical protein
VRLSREFRLFALFFITGLAMTFARHGVKTHWDSLESVEQFFEYWLIYSIPLALLVAFTSVVIFASSEFFLGYRLQFGDRLSEVVFHILMTVLVVVIVGFLVWRYVPTDFLD